MEAEEDLMNDNPYQANISDLQESDPSQAMATDIRLDIT